MECMGGCMSFMLGRIAACMAAAALLALRNAWDAWDDSGLHDGQFVFCAALPGIGDARPAWARSNFTPSMHVTNQVRTSGLLAC